MTWVSYMATILIFSKLLPNFYQKRREVMPAIPKTASEFAAMAPNHPVFFPNYRGSVEVGGETVVTFAKQETLELINQFGREGQGRKVLSFDGTFHTTPRQFHQMFCVFVKVI